MWDLCLDSYFGVWILNCSSIICWKSVFSPLPLLLCQRSAQISTLILKWIFNLRCEFSLWIYLSKCILLVGTPGISEFWLYTYAIPSPWNPSCCFTWFSHSFKKYLNYLVWAWYCPRCWRHESEQNKQGLFSWSFSVQKFWTKNEWFRDPGSSQGPFRVKTFFSQ